MFSKKKYIFTLFSIVCILICSMLACFFCVRIIQQRPSQKITIRLGLPLQPSGALLMIALENKLFQKHGIQIIVKEYPSGKCALNEGLFKDKVDIAGAADLPVAYAAMTRKDFKIIAGICSTDNVNSIIARKDAGIAEIVDLKGKRIATQQNSAVHYFLHLFLLANMISEKDVNLSFMNAKKLPESIVSGRIDAFSMREPYIGQAKKVLKQNHLIFSSPGLYKQYDLLLVKESLLDQYPDSSCRILKALVEAEQFVKKFPDKFKSLTAIYLNSDQKTIAKYWNDLMFQVSLEQSLIIRLEDEARWIIRDQKLADKKVPDYLTLIHQKPLKEICPASVSIY